MPSISTKPAPRNASDSDIVNMSTEELLSELAEGLGLTAKSLLRNAIIWIELEHRGVDLGHLRGGLTKWLPHIATNKLAPESVMAFASDFNILRSLCGVPLDQQKRIADGELIEVAVPGSKEIVKQPIANLKHRLHFIIQNGVVLSPNEQWALMSNRVAKTASPVEGHRKFKPKMSDDGQSFKIGKMNVNKMDIINEMSASAGPDIPVLKDHPEDFIRVSVDMHKEEHERLLKMARSAKLPEGEILRKAFRAFGAI